MKRNLLATAALSTLLLATACDKKAGDGPSNNSATVVDSKAAPTSPAPVQGNRDELLKDAVSALQETENAIAALDAKDAAGAKEALANATGKLEIVLAQNPDLALAPVDVSVASHDLLASVDAVKALRESAEDALEDGRVQDARHLIEGLASESVVSISNLPLATYPAAIKSAAALVAQNKLAEARATLVTALGTIVVHDVIHPLPLIRASAAIEEARKLAAVSTRSAADDAKIKQLLSTARDQLKLGQALGYATKDEMKELLKTVDEIEEGVKDKKSGVGIFDRIRAMFGKANESSQPKKN
ncbi:MAG: hypothetical protein DI606_15960 [Sphingobium sp.]|uniref:YfdX family protein n=1 Tax=Sphingobium sp. TaxID=1912891 RepID=UPI000DB275CA|nr:YfdX family protein [Sphingobium sp.]PZU07909.1 MAG: hypothetical protein DI606_15960 [Sphingobium sp.]